jgi:hypothetical protein
MNPTTTGKDEMPTMRTNDHPHRQAPAENSHEPLSAIQPNLSLFL